MKRVLVTGVNGFVGKHLTRELKKRKLKVIGIGHHAQANPEIVDSLDSYHSCDLTNKEAVSKVPVENVDAVISLAGLARVGDSFADPDRYKKINVEAFSLLAEELITRNPKVRVIAISTGAVYDPTQPMPLTENSELISDGSPYALSKVYMEEFAQKLQEQELDCVVVRPFNHIGPGQEGGFLLPDLYQKVKEAEKTTGILKVGNLKTRRDYTDVRDVARAYADLATAESLQNTLYNVCGGKSLAGEDILKLLLEKMSITGKIQTVEDLNLIRPNDPQNIYGSFERLHKETGWEPQIAIEQTIEDFVSSN